MCGRFALAVDLKTLIDAFGITIVPEELPPRYNIAPSQQVAGIRQLEDGNRRLDYFRWGLIPHWAKEPGIGYKLINARVETAAEKPSFRSSFRARRCLIPASGYYEWKKEEKRKIPFCIRQRDGTPMAFAGLWDSWQGPDGVIGTCSILTTEANEAVGKIHNRMPVILSQKAIDPWLDPRNKETALLASLLGSYHPGNLEIYEVDPLVNSPKNDLPACLEPAP